MVKCLRSGLKGIITPSNSLPGYSCYRRDSYAQRKGSNDKTAVVLRCISS
jgi:hypothetical protein